MTASISKLEITISAAISVAFVAQLGAPASMVDEPIADLGHADARGLESISGRPRGDPSYTHI